MKNPVRNRVLMLVENNPFPQDVRVYMEAHSLASCGYQVLVICPARYGQPWREKIDGIYVFRYPSPPTGNTFFKYFWEYGYSWMAMFFISLFVCFKPGFDIIHAANPPDTMVFIAAFYKLFGKLFIFDHHDLAPELYHVRFGNKNNKLIYRILLWLEKISCRYADHVIVTNQSYKDMDLRRNRVSKERITIVRNGPNDFLPQIAPKAEPRHHEKTIILYAGTIGFQDGVEYLIRAVEFLVHSLDRNDLFCILIGDGVALSAQKILAKQLNLSDFMSFRGQIDHKKVLKYLRSADICVAPEPSNPYNDRSTMIKIMEYMAAGKPTVCFDLPENRFTARDAALYACPNDDKDLARKIEVLMNNVEKRKNTGEIGRLRIEKELAWFHQEKQLLEAYIKVRGVP